MKMAEPEDDIIERQPHRKTTSQEENSKEETLTGRQTHRKTTSQEDDLTGRRPHRKIDKG